MGKIILITGGARSGKSTIAEKMAQETNEKVTYIATSLPIDDEMTNRIKKHREQRPKDWGLIEGYRNFDFINVMTDETILLDCITIMVTNIMYDEIKDWKIFDKMSPENIKVAANIEKIVLKEIEDLINKLHLRIGESYLVTNEIGLGLVPDTFINRIFRDILGRVNQYLAKETDEVYFCISGIELKIKG